MRDDMIWFPFKSTDDNYSSVLIADGGRPVAVILPDTYNEIENPRFQIVGFPNPHHCGIRLTVRRSDGAAREAAETWWEEICSTSKSAGSSDRDLPLRGGEWSEKKEALFEDGPVERKSGWSGEVQGRRGRSYKG